MQGQKYRFLAAAIGLALTGAVHAVPLITESEAKLPPAPAGLTTRGITRGPGIKVVAPEAGAVAVKSPFSLKIAFEPRGGAKIDLGSVKVTYLKSPSVDLLERVKPGLSAGGIDLAGAEAPPGEHFIRVTLQDSEGRPSSAVIGFTVAK